MAEASFNQDSLSVEETIKMRALLGMKPLGAAADGDGDEPVVDEEAVAEANFAERKEEMRRAKATKDTQERIAKLQNQRALNAKMKGSTLGDASRDDNLDAKAWLKKQKRRAKENERQQMARREREMEEMDKAAYGEDDLIGLKVRHGAEAFESGEDVILTLKDSRVLEAEEDELQNVNLVDDEVDKAAQDRKRKALAQYTGLDDEEFDEDRIGVKADILGKYDEEFSTGKARSEGFRLGAAAKPKAEEEDGDVEMISLGQAPASKVKLNLDFAKDFEVSDYMKEGDKGFKQRKKKKSKNSSRRADDAEEETNGDMEVDVAPSFGKRRVDDGPSNLVDDDDLQAALSRSRRENAKKKPRIKAEDIAAQIASRRDDDNQAQGNGEEDGRITFDDTSEFVRNVNVQSRAAPIKREKAGSPAPGPVASSSKRETVAMQIETGEDGEIVNGDGGDEDMDSEDEDEALAEMAAREGLSLEEYRLKIDSQMKEMAQVKAEGEDQASTEEPVIGNGMAGVLSLLRNQGALKNRSAEEEEREKVQKQKDLWLADYRRRVAQRELERIQARGGNKDQAQRDWEARVREQNEARDALELYKNYQPDINIVYHDEFGRQMTPKEAWKSLSHKFHGKTSGRMKTDKRLKKIAEERKALTMGAGDTPLGMSDAFSRRQEKTGQAHMVLSVGNKQSAPAGESKPRIRR